MYSLSTNRDQNIFLKKAITENRKIPTGEDLKKIGALKSLEQSFYDTFGLMKSNGGNKGGAIAPAVKGIIDPSHPSVNYGVNMRGVREKVFKLNYSILREIAKKTGVIQAIQTTRKMQIKPFARISYNDDEVGFRCKLKDKEGTPDNKDKKVMKEIEKFFLKSGYTNFPGAEEREDELLQILTMATEDMMSIDQIAISLRYNNRGRLIDYWLLDGATVKRVAMDRKQLPKNIKFVQEIQGKILETFAAKDLLFLTNNQSTDIRNRGYGYSYIERSLDLITGWLFAFSFNKEYFNSNSMPKGFMTFEGSALDQTDLEELQRQWMTMFSGIKGMWRTPFLQYAAKYNPIHSSNQDMQWDSYTQVLGNWICAIHGIDPAEMGVRLNQSQHVLNENQSAKIAYSKDRGLKELVGFHELWMNKIIDKIPEWEAYEMCLTGVEAKDQQESLNVDKGQVETYMTLNEKRKEHDMKPIENGDVILNPQFIQYQQSKEQAEQMGGGGMEGMEGGGEEPGGLQEDFGQGLDDNQKNALESATESDIEQAAGEVLGKSKIFDDSKDFIEVEI